jgi:hypothetical protein
MRKLTLAPALVVAAGLGYVIFAVSAVTGGVLVGAIGVTTLAFLLTRCRHPYPALQPPIVDDLGQRHPPHWYCDDCGRRWVARFEHDSQPVMRFAGFDPEKAVDAARRADELVSRRREMAVARAGLGAQRKPLTPVSIEEHRGVRAAR